MATATASVTFECEDATDAQKKIDAWKLHEGCTVYATVTEPLAQGQVDARGKVAPLPPPSPDPPPAAS
jgi:hypothetical protein